VGVLGWPELVIIFGFVLPVFVVLWLPTIIAFKRKHPQAAGIILVNFLLGWTVIGWVVALVWATRHSPVRAGPPAETSSPAVGRCPDCGGVVSIHVESCPHCGRPKQVTA
jgi:RsiW-degrading membrane proteinase PrsW (M82 family)